MRLRNRWGTVVDAVPFLVVVLTGFATCYSFGPVYLLTFDLSVRDALLASTGVYGVVIAGAYYRLVWTYRPEHREEIPVGIRFRRLLLAMAVGLGVAVLLVLPLVAR